MLRTLFIILNIFLYLVNILLWVILPELIKMNLPLTLFNLSFTALIIYPHFERVKAYFTSAHFAKLTQKLIGIFLFVAIMATLNFLAFRKPFYYDGTQSQVNTLSKQTRTTLQNFPGQIKAKVFIRRQDAAQIVPLLQLYQLEKDDFIYEVIDPDLRPDEVKKHGITHYGAIEISGNGKKHVLLAYDERGITLTLLRLARKVTPKLYWSTGHGEIDLDDKTHQGATHLKQLLSEHSYEIHSHSLLEKGKIPFDQNSIFILMEPKNQISEKELALIQNYIEQGGNMILALSPETTNRPKLTQLRQLFKPHGINWINQLVIDPESFVQGSKGMVPLIKDFPRTHPISATFMGPLFFPLTSHFYPLPLENWTWSSLVRSSPQSYGEGQFKNIVEENFSKKQGSGGLNLAMAGINKKTQSKVVLLGNGSFVTNAYSNFSPQYLFFLNLVNWQTQAKWVLESGQGQATDEIPRLNSFQLTIMNAVSLLLIPTICLLMALVVHLRKRKI